MQSLLNTQIVLIALVAIILFVLVICAIKIGIMYKDREKVNDYLDQMIDLENINKVLERENTNQNEYMRYLLDVLTFHDIPHDGEIIFRSKNDVLKDIDRKAY